MDLSILYVKTFNEIKSNIRLPGTQLQTPELAYDCFRTVMGATSKWQIPDCSSELISTQIIISSLTQSLEWPTHQLTSNDLISWNDIII